MSTMDRWRSLLEYARWAPSPHNIQPWLLRPVSDDEALLLYEPDRLLPQTDPTGAFTICGLGIFVEHLAIAARSRGLDLDVDYDGAALGFGGGAARPVARLALVERPIEEPLSPELLLERRTSRLPYNGEPVPPRLLEELASLAETYGHRFAFSNEPETVDWVLGLNCDTMFYDMEDPVARGEVGHWIRYSNAAARRRRDGFSPEALGFPGWLLWFFVHTRWLFELPGLKQLIRRLYLRTMRGVRTVGWLIGPFGSPDETFRAGRMLARIWLTLTANGIYLHPFGSVITNPRANARLRERIGFEDEHGIPWLVVRLGRSEQPPRSLRLETDTLLAA
jgi:hypothetical protein